MKPKKQTEKEIKAAIRGFLRTLGIFHFNVFQTLGSERGVSDLIGAYKGRFLAIEVKTKGGKLSLHQERFLERVNRSGGLGFVARSVDDVIENFEIQDRFKKQKPNKSNKLLDKLARNSM